ncbi:MAG: hypothetical protein L0Z62_50360 [Gemmataceae bacterium]|nr:hypothetical protein [Gemmataceae bacterium]
MRTFVTKLFGTQKKAYGRPKPTARLDLEALESRWVPTSVGVVSGQRLLIDATYNSSAESATVDYNATQTQVVVWLANGSTYSFSTSYFRTIQFNGSNASDAFTNNTAISATAYGRLGNDTLTGGSAYDFLVGESGNDVLDGRGGNDVLQGGAGSDLVTGGAGIDRFEEQNGSASVSFRLAYSPWGFYATGYYVISGGGTIVDSMDFVEEMALWGLGGNDTIDARSFSGQRLTLIGHGGNDTLYGSDNATCLDNLQGGDGNDVLYGMAGNDTLWGNAGNDSLYGGAGNDVLYADLIDAIVDGGSGTNQIYR